MRQEVPFVNDIGQEIQVGDKVVVVTKSTQRVRSSVGVYLGLTENGNVQARVKCKVYGCFNKETNERVSWHEFYKASYNDRRERFEGKYMDGERISTLQCNRIFKLAA